MMKILLIEPNYKNKYPPMGLMKISTYHKSRGDIVRFYKGCMPEDELKKYAPERVYITSLFTFYYDKVLNTLKYYRRFLADENIFLGGIMVTILYDKVVQETGLKNLMSGLLENSEVLGLGDNVNVDQLPLDYSILNQIDYEYPAEGNYFAYTTRGCPNKCSFCAVPILEPQFHATNNIKKQIIDVNLKYGEKRNLLLLDNNIFNLTVEELEILVEDLKAVGFTKEPTFIKDNAFDDFIKKSNEPYLHDRVVDAAVKYMEAFPKRIKNERQKEEYLFILDLLKSCKDKKYFMKSHKNWIKKYIDKYTKKIKLQRYIDFNQGLEAARMTPQKMAVLAQLPLRPVRIAFDHYNPGAVTLYKKAVKTAAQCGITEFSNYMLYNFDDKPEDLWYRIRINIDLAKELNIRMFSFPMKYMPITETDRSHIGLHWNKKYLQSVQAILLVTKGIVAGGEEFFERAFGETVNKFYEILAMPKDFIIYRKYYEDKGYTQIWKQYYDNFSEDEKKQLIQILSGTLNEYAYNTFEPILEFYGTEYRYTYLRKSEADF